MQAEAQYEVAQQQLSPITRTLLSGFQNSNYFDFVQQIRDSEEANDLLARGEVAFVIRIPLGFTRKLIKRERPQLLIEVDASDPAAASNALASAREIVNRALASELDGSLAYLQQKQAPVELIIHRKYNPEGITQYNIVPGL